jgi:hypothetical protein
MRDRISFKYGFKSFPSLLKTAVILVPTRTFRHFPLFTAGSSRKTHPSARRASAENTVCKDIDIFSKYSEVGENVFVGRLVFWYLRIHTALLPRRPTTSTLYIRYGYHDHSHCALCPATVMFILLFIAIIRYDISRLTKRCVQCSDVTYRANRTTGAAARLVALLTASPVANIPIAMMPLSTWTTLRQNLKHTATSLLMSSWSQEAISKLRSVSRSAITKLQVLCRNQHAAFLYLNQGEGLCGENGTIHATSAFCLLARDFCALTG